MLGSEQIEELICVVSAFDRSTLIQQMTNYRASFPLDFSSEFLNTHPLDRLRHIFLAICLQTRRMPELNSIESLDAACTAEAA